MIYNKVTLSFDIALLLKQLQLRSIYTANHVLDNTGKTQEKTVSITDAELDLANISLQNAANDVYQKVQSLTRNSGTPFIYNYQNPATLQRTIVYELWLNENWDSALAQALNLAIQKVLINYCSKDWYSTIGQQIGYQVSQANYEEAVLELKHIIHSRKTAIRRPHNTI